MSAVAFYSDHAEAFHASYRADANRQERVRVWRDFFDRYAAGVAFAYDIGCGSGIFACELARRGVETVGIDGAAPMIAIAERVAREENLAGVSFRQCALPASDAHLRPADLVISSSAVEYLESLPQALSFLRGLLKDNGTVIFSLSNRDSLSRKLARLVHCFTGLPRYLALIRHFVTMPELAALMHEAGFDLLEYDYFGRADRMNRFLGRFLPARFSANMIIVAARRRS